MLGVAALEFFADFEIGVLPKAAEIGGDLHGLVAGREQVYNDGGCSSIYAGCIEHAEDFLQADGEYGLLAMGRIAERDAGAAGYGDGFGREFV